MPKVRLDRPTGDLDGVSFGIEYKLVDPIMICLEDIILKACIRTCFKPVEWMKTYWCMDKITVLHDLCKQETVLEVIVSPSANHVHVVQFGESGTNAASGIDGNEGIPGPVLVLWIAGRSVGVVETLDNLGAKDINVRSDIETCLLIEC